MAKRDKAGEALDRAVQLRQEPDVAVVVAELRKLLAVRSAIVVAEAATVIHERGVSSELRAEQNAAFDRFLVQADPGCSAKTALVAGNALDTDRLRIAIQHVQMEGSYGPPIDVACAMRGQAAFGLLDAKHPDALRLIVPLLDDSDREGQITDARRGAIRALGTVIGETSAIMLRMTARRFAGDPETLAECFASLNGIEPVQAFDFVADYLRADDAAIVDTAALAIAESKRPAALPTLLDAWRRRGRFEDGDATAYLTAIALTRKPAAIDALLAIVEESPRQKAIEALAALALFQSDAAVCQRVQSLVVRRRDPSIDEAALPFGPHDHENGLTS